MSIKSWNPYISGALAGILLVASVAVAGQFLGASTTFSRSAAFIEEKAGVDTNRFDYFTTKGGKYGPGSLPNWQLMFVLGVIVGSFVISTMSGSFKYVPVPPMWAERFGSNPYKRAAAAFAGGAVAFIRCSPGRRLPQWPRIERSVANGRQRFHCTCIFFPLRTDHRKTGIRPSLTGRVAS